MSGGTQERTGEATLADRVAHLRYQTSQAREWADHPVLGPETAAAAEEYAAANPDAVEEYNRQLVATQARWGALGQGAIEPAVSHPWENLASTDPAAFEELCRVHQLDADDIRERSVRTAEISQGLID